MSKGCREKKIHFSGPATKRGGGVKAGPLRKRTFFYDKERINFDSFKNHKGRIKVTQNNEYIKSPFTFIKSTYLWRARQHGFDSVYID